MKKIQNIIMAIAMIFAATAANAQSITGNRQGDEFLRNHYENARVTVVHGNNCWKVEAAGAADITDKSFGAEVRVYKFHYNWNYGVSGKYIPNRSAVEVFGGYRFTNPKSPIHFELNAGVGLTEQLRITGTGGSLQEDTFDGDYVMLLGTSKMQLSAMLEARLSVPLSKRIELFAGAKGIWLPYEGKYDAAANTLKFEYKDQPVKIFEKDAEGRKNQLCGKVHNLHLQVAVGLAISL